MGELQMGKEAKDKPFKMQQDTRQNRKSDKVSLVLGPQVVDFISVSLMAPAVEEPVNPQMFPVLYRSISTGIQSPGPPFHTSLLLYEHYLPLMLGVLFSWNILLCFPYMTMYSFRPGLCIRTLPRIPWRSSG